MAVLRGIGRAGGDEMIKYFIVCIVGIIIYEFIKAPESDE